VVGVAEWGRERPDGAVAHVAVAVEESFRRRGVARELIRHLVADARSRGVEEFVASIMTANRPTMALIQDVAPQRRTRFDGTTVEVRIPLSATA
jgi:ribosomal protein S18 acetylase RimI-like enzyme